MHKQVMSRKEGNAITAPRHILNKENANQGMAWGSFTNILLFLGTAQ